MQSNEIADAWSDMISLCALVIVVLNTLSLFAHIKLLVNFYLFSST